MGPYILAPTMVGVTLSKVSKVFQGKVRAVADLSLEAEDGRFVVLVGPSGCGKSTTLRMIAGLEELTSGTISIGGRVVNDVAPKDRDIAMVFQDYALYPHMTVFENMAFGLKLRKMPRSEIQVRVKETAKTLGLGELLDRRPKQLSGGQRQRVALGRAIVRKPAVFLFDEPLSNLDAKMRAQMRVEISRLHQRLAQTMIYVTHDQTEAMTLGDLIVVMKDGVLQQVAEPGRLYDHPDNLFVAGFIGAPSMNFFKGAIRAVGGGLGFDGGALQLPLPESWAGAAGGYVDKPIVLGLRPHDIDLDGAAGPQGGRIKATVDVAEPLGFETYVHLTSGEHRFVCRLSARRQYQSGTELILKPDLSRGHLFDPDTEKTVI